MPGDDPPALAHLKIVLAGLPPDLLRLLRDHLDDMILTDDEVERAHRVALAAAPVRPAVTRRWERVRCGRAGCRCEKAEGRHGPYLYEYWREGGRVRKRYVGRGGGAGPGAREAP